MIFKIKNAYHRYDVMQKRIEMMDNKVLNLMCGKEWRTWRRPTDLRYRPEFQYGLYNGLY